MRSASPDRSLGLYQVGWLQMAFALSVGRPQGRDMVGGGGVGLGLAIIAHTIIQAHGGTVLLYNLEAGGLEAVVFLPLGDA